MPYSEVVIRINMQQSIVKLRLLQRRKDRTGGRVLCGSNFYFSSFLADSTGGTEATHNTISRTQHNNIFLTQHLSSRDTNDSAQTTLAQNTVQTTHSKTTLSSDSTVRVSQQARGHLHATAADEYIAAAFKQAN
eukprot:TRINITY_DN12166_c2_g1_i1.p2 TRINITY_DN12166_c2_g1~~TRINITY_DN12166_c2_g1_i1.p2  ORF type:complete len:134 (+),score=15.86 TRINITY_DN12166_c2_g1_i1:3-404(+)